MVTMEEASIMLDEIAEALPHEFYEKLNGGILLLPNAKLHPNHRNSDLYIMGMYHYSSNMGRYIEIYYGSFEKLYPDISNEQFKQKLKKTLLHEFTHHIESLAGERDLEIKDARRMQRYKQQKSRYINKKKKDE